MDSSGFGFSSGECLPQISDLRSDTQWRNILRPPDGHIPRKSPCPGPICRPGERSPDHRIPGGASQKVPFLQKSAGTHRFSEATAASESAVVKARDIREPVWCDAHSRCIGIAGCPKGNRRPRYRLPYLFCRLEISAGNIGHNHRKGTPIAHGSSSPMVWLSKNVALWSANPGEDYP